MAEEIIVLSLGGSLIVPNKIDEKYLANFRNFIEEEIANGKRFIIVCGGGKTCRTYGASIKKLVNITPTELDLLGIEATKLNAKLIQILLHEFSYPEIIINPTKKIKNFKEKVLIAAGWKPGFSTDYDAVMLAKQFKAEKIINMTNIDYVYNKDPKKYKTAKPFVQLNWNNYLSLIRNDWIPGANIPFDPVASKEAKNNNMNVFIVNGKNLINLKHLIDGEDFKGTKIN
ncbi:MAG: UMP kinase [Nanoarchaeota archaeon]|nr:UMP kinase [Nanoarchaeota archaeon]